MQKVWFGRVWCMAGRWQLMSLEKGLQRPRSVERAWFRSIYAPYYRGAGVALTAGPWSVRLGLCRPGIELEESADEFAWDDLDPGFNAHLEASLFEPGPLDVVDDTVGGLEIEEVTAFVDTRTNTLTAVIHAGGEVEYVKPVGPWVDS